MNGQQDNYAFKRILAETLDLIIFYFVCSVPLFFTFIIITMVSINSNTKDSPFLILLTFLGLLSVPVSYIFLNIRQLEKKSATWGYRVFGLILVNEDGSVLTKKKIISRTIIKLLFIPIYFFWILALIHILIITSSQGEVDLIDRLFKTKAIHKI